MGYIWPYIPRRVLIRIQYTIHLAYYTLESATSHSTMYTKSTTNKMQLYIAYSTLEVHTSHWKFKALPTNCCSLHTTTTHYALHTTHLTLHTTHCTLNTTHYTLHTTHYTINTTHYTLNITHFTIHNAHCTLHTAHWTHQCFSSHSLRGVKLAYC